MFLSLSLVVWFLLLSWEVISFLPLSPITPIAVAVGQVVLVPEVGIVGSPEVEALVHTIILFLLIGQLILSVWLVANHAIDMSIANSSNQGMSTAVV